MEVKWIFSIVLITLITSQSKVMALPNNYVSEYVDSLPTSLKLISKNGVTSYRVTNYYYSTNDGLINSSFGNRIYSGRVYGDRGYGDHRYGDLGYGDFPRDSWIEIPVGPRWSTFQTFIANQPFY